MKHSIIKKLIAAVLCLAMIGVLPAAATAKATAAPVIYLTGLDDTVLYSDPNKYTAETVFDMNSQAFLAAATRIFAGFYFSKEEGINSTTIGQVTGGIKDIMEPIALDKNGNPKDTSTGAWNFPLPVGSSPSDSEIMTENVKSISTVADSTVGYNRFYVCTYDWRIDPLVNAERLLNYIESVLKKARADKVSIIAEGYGGVVANAYLYKYPTHAAQCLESCVFLDAPLMGNTVMGNIMRGRLAKTAADEDSLLGNYNNITGKERGEALTAYMQDDPQGFFSDIIDYLIGTSANATFVGQMIKFLIVKIVSGALSFDDIGKAYNNFALLAGENVYGAGLREYLRNMPGLWALIPEAYYDDAMAFLFPGTENPTSALMTKISHARKVTDSTQNTLKKAKANGIKMYIVANYGVQLLPATVALHDLSDGIESTKLSSAGAITKECGSEWPLHNNCTSFYHDHLSPDKDINANNCALPEFTWFIKGLPNCQFSETSVAKFVVWLTTATTQRNVWETGEYTQYLTYSKYTKELNPYTGELPSNNGIVLGDTDQDGVITAGDARQVLRYAVGLESPSKMMMVAADVDGSGSVDAGDSRLVLRYAVGIISNFPAE